MAASWNWPASLTSEGASHHVQAHVIVEELSAFGHGALAPATPAGAVLVTPASRLPSRPRRSRMSLQLERRFRTRCSRTLVSRFSYICVTARLIGRRRYSAAVKPSNNRGLRTPVRGGGRRFRRATTVSLVPPRVLEGFGIGDAVLAVAATVTGGERRLERFRVALPTLATESYPATQRWKTHVLTFAAGALAAAALVLSSSCLTGREPADHIEHTRHRSLRANAALGRRFTRGIPAAVAEWLSSSVARAPQLSFLRPDRPLPRSPVAGSWKPE